MSLVQEVDLDPGEVYQELHDPEHVTTVIQGFIDTVEQDIDGVTGVESLTNAQHYLEGAMLASGAYRASSVTGNEGFFSNVSEGIQKAWDYVKKMFKAIWNFFFKSEQKELEKKVDKAIDVAYKNLDDIEKIKITVNNVDEVLKNVSAVANKINDEPARKKVQEEIKAAREASTPEAKVKAAIDLPKKVFENFHLYASKNAIAIRGIKESVEKLTKLKEDDKVDLGDEIQKIINGLIGLPEEITDLDDFASAKRYLDKSRSCRIAIGNSLKTIENEKDTYEELFKEVESKIAEAGKNRKKFDELQKLKDGLVTISSIISETKSILNMMIILAEQVSKACGDSV